MFTISGFVGNFTAKIRKKARFIDEVKCTGCGVCTQLCHFGAMSAAKEE